MCRARVGRGEKGQVLPFALLLLVLTGVVLLLLAQLGRAAVARARARTAADAAALAGVGRGEAAARQVARANGGRLVRFEWVGAGDALVQVRLGAARATARARCGYEDDLARASDRTGTASAALGGTAACLGAGSGG